MRLGKTIKINTIIAILLCMAFVVNIGYTFAAVSFSFMAKSSIGESASNIETYTEFANAQGTSGKYTYSVGSKSNQLSINYGFSNAHDLMIEFTATYADTTHQANDFSLNFVNRDMWCVDMAIVSGLSTQGGSVQNFYALASTSNTIRGVMYYMGTLTGSDTLPVLSGVTFYTSPNNSYTHIGDTLTITLTPRYVKTSNTYTNHSFGNNLLGSDSTAFNNWVDYMNSGTGIASSKYMIYNAYANNATALQYPSDYNWTEDGFDISKQAEKTYSNTAYRYSITKESETKTNRTYSALMSGNKYYGGLGVYVIPNASLKTVSVSVRYGWQKNGTVDGTIPVNMVQLAYHSDIKTVTTTIEDDEQTEDVDESVQYNTYYYRATISKPTYINVFDHIMLTAEAPTVSMVLTGGYSLVITGLTVTAENANPAGWTPSARTTYEVNNSTSQSPLLVRVKDVNSSEKMFETNVSVTNNNNTPLAITSFSVKAELWYGDYSGNNSAFAKQVAGYLNETPVNKQLTNNALVYDKNIWEITSFIDNVYTFQRKNAVSYVAGGYSMPLITGVTVPEQYYPEATDVNFTPIISNNEVVGYEPIYVNDLWCSLDVQILSTSTVSVFNAGTTTNAEVTTTGYYSIINAESSAYVYLRNNTQQNITNVSISNLTLSAIGTQVNLLPRENLNTSTAFTYSITNHLTSTTETGVSANTAKSISTDTLIRPNEMILLYTIVPNANSVIYTYNITTTLASGLENAPVDVIFNNNTKTGEIINNSDTHYEFRLQSSVKLTSNLVNSADFVEQIIEGENPIYYYYYKGVICSKQFISVLSNIDDSRNITINSIPHIQGVDHTHYVAENYQDWAPPTEWLSIMQGIYGLPTR